MVLGMLICSISHDSNNTIHRINDAKRRVFSLQAKSTGLSLSISNPCAASSVLSSGSLSLAIGNGGGIAALFLAAAPRIDQIKCVYSHCTCILYTHFVKRIRESNLW